MPERSAREFARAWQEMLAARELDRLSEFLRPDCVHEYPQSGERFVGIANIRGVFENYPGGLGTQLIGSLRVADHETPWAMAPNFTLIRMTGAGDSYTSAVRARYPDGTDWYIVSMIELKDGLMSHATMFFGPVFEAPEWRKPFAEAEAGS
jgi:ketosteroid isomerase-like protein